MLTLSLSSALLLFVIAFPLLLHFHYLSLPLSSLMFENVGDTLDSRKNSLAASVGRDS